MLFFFRYLIVNYLNYIFFFLVLNRQPVYSKNYEGQYVWQFFYDNGQESGGCSIFGRSTNLVFICDETVITPRGVAYEVVGQDCTYQMNITTMYACPK